MRKVTFNKICRDEIEVLQHFCSQYAAKIESELNPQLTITFFTLIIEADILQRLIFFFRARLESDSSKYILKFQPSDAAVLFFVCQDWFQKKSEAEETDAYKTLVATKFANGIDAQLKSVIVRPKEPQKLLI